MLKCWQMGAVLYGALHFSWFSSGPTARFHLTESGWSFKWQCICGSCHPVITSTRLLSCFVENNVKKRVQKKNRLYLSCTQQGNKRFRFFMIPVVSFYFVSTFPLEFQFILIHFKSRVVTSNSCFSWVLAFGLVLFWIYGVFVECKI